MHILLEGVLHLEIKSLLNEFVSIKKYFTVDILNECIQNFTYGKAEIRNKPPKPLQLSNLSSGDKIHLSGEL